MSTPLPVHAGRHWPTLFSNPANTIDNTLPTARAGTNRDRAIVASTFGAIELTISDMGTAPAPIPPPMIGKQI